MIELYTKRQLIEVWKDGKEINKVCCPDCRDNLVPCDKDGIHNDYPYDTESLGKFLTCPNGMCRNETIYIRDAVKEKSKL